MTARPGGQWIAENVPADQQGSVQMARAVVEGYRGQAVHAHAAILLVFDGFAFLAGEPEAELRQLAADTHSAVVAVRHDERHATYALTNDFTPVPEPEVVPTKVGVRVRDMYWLRQTAHRARDAGDAATEISGPDGEPLTLKWYPDGSRRAEGWDESGNGSVAIKVQGEMGEVLLSEIDLRKVR